MAGAAGQHEDVPQVVGVELARPQVRLVRREDDRADAVGDAARVQPGDGGGGDGVAQRGHGDGDQPAHDQVDGDPRPVREALPDQAAHNADYGQPVFDPEQGPPPRPAQAHQADRRIRPRDQQEDGDVVEAHQLEDLLRLDPQRVVQRGGRVQYDQAHAKHGEGDRLPNLPVRQDQQHDQGRDGQRRPQPVRQAAKRLPDEKAPPRLRFDFIHGVKDTPNPALSD